MDIRGLRVTKHAVLRYGQRVERRPWGDDYHPSKEERDELSIRILRRLEGSKPLPTHCCLFFVKPGKGACNRNVQRALADGTLTASAGETAWGTYAYDGRMCFVIEENEIVTVFEPDGEQRQGLEDLLDKLACLEETGPPSSGPLDLDGQRGQLLQKAILINESRGNDAPEYPKPASVEICYPDCIVPDEFMEKPEFVAEFLRWIGRVVPVRGKPVLLIMDRHFKVFASVTDLLADGGLETTLMPYGFDQHALAVQGEKAPGYAFVRNAVSIVPTEYSHTFVLCTRSTVSAVLGVARRHAASFEKMTGADYVKGTVFAIDHSKPFRERFHRFSM